LQLEKKDAAETRKFSTIPLTFIAGETWTSRQLGKVADVPVEYLHGTVFVVVEVTKEGERHGKLCRRQVSHSQNKDGLTIESDKKLDHISARTVMWAGGITASVLGRILPGRTKADTDKGGRVKVKPDLTIPNYPDIYVIGDLASSVDAQGKPLPGLAQVAMQGGQYAAKSILRKVKSRPELPPFQYFDKEQGLTGGDWALGCSGQCLRCSSLGTRCPNCVGLYSPDVYRDVPRPALSLHPMGDPGLNVQSWSAAYHRCCRH
jgi:Pyridine nucleotide-disulphide oxidoreductase